MRSAGTAQVDVAPPVPRELLAAELTDRTLVARFRDLEVHLVSAREAPGTMQEIGRIREREFRAVGAGRNVACDVDRFDLEFPWYSQLVSWDPEAREIVALYRAIHCGWALRNGGLQALRTSTLFRFSERFVPDYLTHAVELGRSVVNRDARRALQGLFSVWTGLGAIVRGWPDVRMFFGNASLYKSLPADATRRILGYLRRHHGAQPGLVVARLSACPAGAESSAEEREASSVAGREASLEQLLAAASAEGWPFPPILLSYLKAHPNLLAFDAAVDDDFGGAVEVAIAVPTTGLNPKTVARFVEPYTSINPGRFILPERA